jgi:hypothetical protein
MKRLFVLMIAAMALAGCSGDSAAGGTTGIVDCYEVRVTNGGSNVFSGTYQESFSRVYEYKNDKGNAVYSDTKFTAYDSASGRYVDGTVVVYPERYSHESIVYKFTRFVGFLTFERNYLLNLGSRTIDSEIKWSEYKYKNDPEELAEGVTSDNKEAYNCAKKGYYPASGFAASGSMPIYTYIDDSRLVRHSYTRFGDDSVITYTAKWF